MKRSVRFTLGMVVPPLIPYIAMYGCTRLGARGCEVMLLDDVGFKGKARLSFVVNGSLKGLANFRSKSFEK